MQIAGRTISNEQPPYLVAECGSNHRGMIDEAIRMVRAAKAAGADAVKFQAYTPDTITIDCDGPDFIVKDGPWKYQKLYNLYKRAHTPFRWFPWLFEAGQRDDITVFASVFDKSSVDMLEELDCPAYKIASFEITDIPLIKYAASTGKPLIISTGMASDDDIKCAVDAASIEMILLHCTSGYPTPINEAGLARFASTKPWFFAGISDHTVGTLIPIAATALGAQLIEKHFTLDRDNGSEDAAFSMERREFGEMARLVRMTWEACRSMSSKSEESSRQMRRSLYVVEDIKAGQEFGHNNVRSIRPGYGLPPVDIEKVIGRKAVCDIQRGTALKWEMVG